MASVLRGVAGRIVTGVSQVVSILAPRTTLSHCNSLTLSQRLLCTSKPVPSCVAGMGRPLCKFSIAPFASPSVFSLAAGTSILSRVGSFIPVTVTQTRDYHVRRVLKRRCEGCYFVRRKGRMFVECKLKPRHRQMQMMAKRNLWRDDYTKGNVAKAVFWKYAEKRYYKLGDNEFARHDWLKGKIGVTV